MANTVQIKRGSNASVSAHTGPSGELIYNLDTGRLHAQDGSTAGGKPHALVSDVDMKANAATQVIAGDGLTGGGNLAASRTLALNSTSIASLAKADTAVQSVNGKSGSAVAIVKGDVGLGNVDNTSDASKPISTATQTALNAKANSAITVTAGSGLTGGGNLTANRTVALNAASIASLAKADTALQAPGGTTGQILAKSSNATNDVAWVSSEAATAVSYGPQTLTPTQQAQARKNIAADVIFDSKAALEAASVSAEVNAIYLSGYYDVGDGGGAFYKRVATEPVHAGKVPSLDGAWWELAEQKVYPEMFGAIPGPSDVSSRMLDAINYCEGRQALYMSGAEYRSDITKTLNGRLIIKGDKNTFVNGTWNISGDFPASADPVDITETSPYLNISGVNFKSIDTNKYALTIAETNDVGKFIDTMSIDGCNFWGRLGLNTKSLSTASILECRFYNTSIGWLAESCTNFSVFSSYWRNAANKAVHITKDNTNPLRSGGENIRFIGCEFDVCAVGVMLDRHFWGVFEACLFDYCITPLWLSGSIHCKLSKTYLGAATIASVVSHPDYVAPPSQGIALYATGTTVSGSTYASGLTANNCEFVCYNAGSTQPIVLADGFLPAVAGKHVDRAAISQSKFIFSANHSSDRLANFSYCQNVSLHDNQFISPDKSTSLAMVYNISDHNTYSASNNDASLVTQSGSTLPLPLEQTTTRKIKMTGDSLQIVNQNNEVVGEFLNTGGDRFRTYISGQMRTIGKGPNDSAGAGYSNIIIPN